MKKTLELITQFDGEVFDLCYKLLCENDQHCDIFQFVCENLLTKPEKPSIQIKKYFEESEIKEYEALYGDIVDGIIKSTIKKCDYGIVKPEDFYKTVWESYCTNFESLKEKAFAFYYTVIDKRIPYVYIGKPLSMDNEKYREIINNNAENLKKIKYIFNSSYRQRTEISSLILQCVNNIDDYESKVVVLAKALEINSIKTAGGKSVDVEEVLQEINRKIKELEQDET